MARIAIVGAGPAGSSAGWHLATRGHAVTLIDRAAFPRPKTCGDWIPLGAVAELERLGLTPRDLEREAAEHAAIDSTAIVAPNGRQTTSAGRATAYCIPRLVFDDLLWRRAVAAGCTPRRASVRDVARDPELSRDFDQVIDARGAHAGTPNAVALRAYWTVRRDRVRDDEASCVQIHTDAVFRRGYGWIFPVHVQADSVRFNLGVGLWKDDSVPGRDIKDFYARFVETNAVLARWREGAGHRTAGRVSRGPGPSPQRGRDRRRAAHWRRGESGRSADGRRHRQRAQERAAGRRRDCGGLVARRRGGALAVATRRGVRAGVSRGADGFSRRSPAPRPRTSRQACWRRHPSSVPASTRRSSARPAIARSGGCGPPDPGLPLT